MSDVLSTLCSRPLTKEERSELVAQSKVLGIYNKAVVVFNVSENTFWAILNDKRIQLSKSEVAKLGISTKGCLV